jgi:hypothetical protein
MDRIAGDDLEWIGLDETMLREIGNGSVARLKRLP